jgi:hypothetical protein
VGSGTCSQTVPEVLTDDFDPFEPGLEGLLSPLGFALEGISVHLNFPGPAVRTLARGHQPKLKGWTQPFTRFAATGTAEAGHVPAPEKLHQLRSLGAQIDATIHA